MRFCDRSLIITDIETTGLNHRENEIIEIGALKVHQQTLQVLDEFERKTIFLKPELFTESAKRVNGYKKEDWENAIYLPEAIINYSDFGKDGIFVAHNVTFDWSFIEEAFYKFSIDNKLDYHRIDLPSIIWAISEPMDRFSLDAVCEKLGIPKEEKPHKAINGAKQILKVLRKLKGI